jgi:hypothetical protein
MKKLLLILCVLNIFLCLNAQTNEEKKDSIQRILPTVVFSHEDYVLKIKESCPTYHSEEEKQAFFEEYIPIIIPEYFLLGTLNPPLRGKVISEIDKDCPNQKAKHFDQHFQKNVFRENEVARFSNHEEILVNYLEEYLYQSLGIKISTSTKENKKDEISIYSPELAPTINNFFDEETGRLKSDLFITKEEICSYLLGVYYRFGEKTEDDTYEIKTHNLYIGPDRMFSLLRKSSVYDIQYSLFTLSFKPSLLLKKYFETIESEKEKEMQLPAPLNS